MFNIRNTSTIYVSPTHGSYRASGLAPMPDGYGNGPYPTIDAALFYIGEMRKNGVDRPLRLVITEDIFLPEAITLTKDHKRLTIESLGARKRIIGGVKIDGWKKDTFRGVACLSAKLPEKKNGEKWAFTDLFVNGKRADVTRYPESGTLTVVDTEDQFLDGPGHEQSCVGSSRWFVVNKEDLAGLDNIEDATINYYHWWIDEHSPIESYDPETGKLVMTLASKFSCSANYEQHASDCTRYYLTNIPNGFAKPGQWYLDRNAQVVYYIPENDTITPETIEAIAPTLSKLVTVEGEDICLRNLEFYATAGDYVSTEDWPTKWKKQGNWETPGYASDKQSAWNAPGAITFQNAEGGGIFDCHIHGVGIYGIEISRGCNHIRIENNHIEDICAGGVKILGGDAQEDMALRTTDILIHGNEIHGVGKRYQAGCGILLMHAANNEISHNEIYDTEYSGISLGWVWGYADSTTYRNRIIRNHIHHIGKGNLSDMGGIYILGRNRGTVVAENRIHDITESIYGAWGLYIDEGGSYITMEKNVVYKTKSQCFHLHYGAHNIVRNNIFFGMGSPCLSTAREEHHDQVLFENNILVVEDAQIYRTKGYHTMRTGRNILFDLSGNPPRIYEDEFDVKYDWETWTTVFGHDKGTVIADPKIPGIREFDFRLEADSPAYALGFQPIPDYVTKGK